jgi:outer membrane protein assembly factor BamB
MKRPSMILCIPLCLCASVVPSLAEDWPSWRGPRADGTCNEKDFPLKWSATENIAWKTPIPGRGHSSPIVSGERIFVTTCLEGDPRQDKDKPRDRVLLCLNRANGHILWKKVIVSAPLERIHAENSYASATPATDGKYVYVSFLAMPKVIVACYDFDGNEVWTKSPGEFHSVHGFGCPPVLYNNLVLINADQDKPNAYLVAIDRKTGEERWRGHSFLLPAAGVRGRRPQAIGHDRFQMRGRL